MTEWNTYIPSEDMIVILLVKTWWKIETILCRWLSEERRFVSYGFKHPIEVPIILGWIPFPSESILRMAECLEKPISEAKKEADKKHKKWKEAERKLKDKNKKISELREKIKENEKCITSHP